MSAAVETKQYTVIDCAVAVKQCKKNENCFDAETSLYEKALFRVPSTTAGVTVVELW